MEVLTSIEYELSTSKHIYDLYLATTARGTRSSLIENLFKRIGETSVICTKHSGRQNRWPSRTVERVGLNVLIWTVVSETHLLLSIVVTYGSSEKALWVNIGSAMHWKKLPQFRVFFSVWGLKTLPYMVL